MAWTLRPHPDGTIMLGLMMPGLGWMGLVIGTAEAARLREALNRAPPAG